MLSFLASNDYFFNDANPTDPVNGAPEYKHFDLGLEPAVYFELKHWRWGVKYHVGLLNTKRLPGTTDSYHYQDVTLVVNFHF